MTPDRALPIGAGALLACAWLRRRWPTALLAIVLASFAVGPEWVLARYLPGRLLLLAVPAQELLLIAALAANAARYGLRPEILRWPLLAVGLLLVQTVLLPDVDPRLSGARIAIAALGLALPFSLAAVALEPGTRARYALLIALLPSLCVAIGAGLQAAGLYAAVTGSEHRVPRLNGASNAGWLACLAFAGFAIALHEAIFVRRPALAGVAAINAVIGLLAGGRMGVGAGVLFTVAYCLLDQRIRARLSRARWPLVWVAVAAALLMLGWLFLQSYGELAAGLPMSGRNVLWAHYFEQFRARPSSATGSARPRWCAATSSCRTTSTCAFWSRAARSASWYTAARCCSGPASSSRGSIRASARSCWPCCWRSQSTA